jgi:hypothetical protein
MGVIYKVITQQRVYMLQYVVIKLPYYFEVNSPNYKAFLCLSILLQAILKRLCIKQSVNNATNCSFFFHLYFNTTCFGPRWPSSGVLIYQNCYTA